jgi:hypothetical protein
MHEMGGGILGEIHKTVGSSLSFGIFLGLAGVENAGAFSISFLCPAGRALRRCSSSMKPDRRDPLKNLPRFKNLAVLKDLPWDRVRAVGIFGDCPILIASPAIPGKFQPCRRRDGTLWSTG